MSDEQNAENGSEPKPGKGDSRLKITFKKSTWEAIEIDMDQLTWGDSLQLLQYRDKAIRGELTSDDAAKILNGMVAKVTGHDPMIMPTHVVNEVAAAIWANVDGNADQGN